MARFAFLRLAVASAVLALSAGAGQAHEVKAGALTLSQLQVRASLGQSPNTAAYLTIANAGAADDQLLSATCACARGVQAHRTQMTGTLSAMPSAGPVTIPAHGAVAFQPGGLHLMVMGLKAPLKEGATQTFTLRFAKAGLVTAAFHVKAQIEAAPAGHGAMAGMPGM